MVVGRHVSEQVIAVLPNGLEKEKRFIVLEFLNNLVAVITQRRPKSISTRLTAVVFKKIYLDAFLFGKLSIYTPP